MKNTLILTENQTHFLQENRQDPITGDEFFVGDEIVFCASCKSAFLKESWDFMDGKHCNQRKILRNFPISERLLLEKPQLKLNITFIETEMENRLAALFIDIVLICSFSFTFVTIFWFLNIFNKLPFLENLYIYIGVVLFIFRDVILSNKSIGKHIMNLYFINNITKKQASFYKVFLRNIMWWITVIPLVYIFYLTRSIFILLIILFIIIGYCLFFVTQNQSPIDKLLGIKLVESKRDE